MDYNPDTTCNRQTDEQNAHITNVLHFASGVGKYTVTRRSLFVHPGTPLKHVKIVNFHKSVQDCCWVCRKKVLQFCIYRTRASLGSRNRTTTLLRNDIKQRFISSGVVFRIISINGTRFKFVTFSIEANYVAWLLTPDVSSELLPQYMCLTDY